jgi:hypothetical protein
VLIALRVPRFFGDAIFRFTPFFVSGSNQHFGWNPQMLM